LEITKCSDHVVFERFLSVSHNQQCSATTTIMTCRSDMQCHDFKKDPHDEKKDPLIRVDLAGCSRWERRKLVQKVLQAEAACNCGP
jgi:hypothetical protein